MRTVALTQGGEVATGAAGAAGVGGRVEAGATGAGGRVEAGTTGAAATTGAESLMLELLGISMGAMVVVTTAGAADVQAVVLLTEAMVDGGTAAVDAFPTTTTILGVTGIDSVEFAGATVVLMKLLTSHLRREVGGAEELGLGDGCHVADGAGVVAFVFLALVVLGARDTVDLCFRVAFVVGETGTAVVLLAGSLIKPSALALGLAILNSGLTRLS